MSSDLFYEIFLCFEGRKGFVVVFGFFFFVFVVDIVIGFEKVVVVELFMNEYWERVLMWFGENLNENDIVFVWWDYGMWVIYYVRCVLVVELVFNIGVVLYYFGKCDENWVMGFGVDYVIVFYYDFLKFGMIVDIVMMCLRCNVSENYGFVVLFMVFLVGVLVFRNLGYMVVVRFGEKWDVKISVSGYVFGLWEVYVEYGDKIIKLNIMLFEFGVYFYINFNYNYVIFMNGEVFNINLVRFFIKLDGFYELVYFDGGIIKILRFKYLNVVVERRGGEIFF